MFNIYVKSKTIEDFLNLLDYCKKNLELELENAQTFNQKEKDLLHILELEKLSNSQRNKLNILLKKNRIERRKCKNMIELIEPIVQFHDENLSIIGKSKNLLGKVRKVEELQKERAYLRKFEWDI